VFGVRASAGLKVFVATYAIANDLSSTLILALFKSEHFARNDDGGLPIPLSPPQLLTRSSRNLNAWVKLPAGHDTRIAGMSPFRFGVSIELLQILKRDEGRLFRIAEGALGQFRVQLVGQALPWEDLKGHSPGPDVRLNPRLLFGGEFTLTDHVVRHRTLVTALPSLRACYP
jgi:hypothetical protein